MSKYTLTIGGDFEKYNCNKCPLGVLSVGGFVCVMDDGISCPLEEATVAKNATVEGEWIECFEDWRGQLAGEKCSVCGFEHYSVLSSPYNFCPSCGAKMKGGVKCIKRSLKFTKQ